MQISALISGLRWHVALVRMLASATLLLAAPVFASSANAAQAKNAGATRSSFEQAADCAADPGWESQLIAATADLVDRGQIKINCLSLRGTITRFSGDSPRTVTQWTAGAHRFSYEVRGGDKTAATETFHFGGRSLPVRAPAVPFWSAMDSQAQIFEVALAGPASHAAPRYLVVAGGLRAASGSASRLRFFHIFALNARGKVMAGPFSDWATDFTASQFGAIDGGKAIGFAALRRAPGADSARFSADVMRLTPAGLIATGMKRDVEVPLPLPAVTPANLPPTSTPAAPAR